MKITRFNLGKRKKYKGIAITFGWFKIERIGFANKFLWRIEFSNWKE
jgi:hypothetical protein